MGCCAESGPENMWEMEDQGSRLWRQILVCGNFSIIKITSRDLNVQEHVFKRKILSVSLGHKNIVALAIADWPYVSHMFMYSTI